MKNLTKIRVAKKYEEMVESIEKVENGYDVVLAPGYETITGRGAFHRRTQKEVLETIASVIQKVSLKDAPYQYKFLVKDRALEREFEAYQFGFTMEQASELLKDWYSNELGLDRDLLSTQFIDFSLTQQNEDDKYFEYEVIVDNEAFEGRGYAPDKYKLGGEMIKEYKRIFKVESSDIMFSYIAEKEEEKKPSFADYLERPTVEGKYMAYFANFLLDNGTTIATAINGRFHDGYTVMKFEDLDEHVMGADARMDKNLKALNLFKHHLTEGKQVNILLEWELTEDRMDYQNVKILSHVVVEETNE